MDIYGNITRVMGSSDVATTAQKDIGKKQKSDTDLRDAGENKETEGQPSTYAHQVKAKALQASMDHEEKLMAIVGGTERKGSEGGEEVTLPLGKENVTMRGVDVVDLTYTKRPEEEQAQLRKEFNSKHRKTFLKDLAGDSEKEEALKNAGLNDTDLKMMSNGKVPPGFQVHHKLPLDDSGTNDFDNLLLIENRPAHMALTNLQMRSIEGMGDGETRTMEWVIPRGFVYPPDPSYLTTSPR